MYGIEAVGVAAGTLTTFAYLPQLISVWRARSGKGLTYPMLFILNAGLALWLAYGLLVDSFSIIWANAITLVLAGTILLLKIRYDLRDRKLAHRPSAVGIVMPRRQP